MKPQRVGQIYVSKWARPDCQKHRRLIRPRFLLTNGWTAAVSRRLKISLLGVFQPRSEIGRPNDSDHSPIHSGASARPQFSRPLTFRFK